MNIFKNVKFMVFSSLLLAVISTLSYFYLTVKLQKVEIDNKNVQIEVAKDEIKKEVLETKWETIAQEHNKSLGEEHEIKEPVEHNDSNTTDFFFFGMFRED